MILYDLLEGSRFVGMSWRGLIFGDQLATSFRSQKPNRCFRLHKFYSKSEGHL